MVPSRLCILVTWHFHSEDIFRGILQMLVQRMIHRVNEDLANKGKQQITERLEIFKCT